MLIKEIQIPVNIKPYNEIKNEFKLENLPKIDMEEFSSDSSFLNENKKQDLNFFMNKNSVYL